jgi:hypothetical protein
MGLRAFEWIVVAYFGYLATAALAVRLPVQRKRRIVLTAVLVVVSVFSLARLEDLRSLLGVREWMPLAYLLAGYWLPAIFVKTPNLPLERALLALDHRWFGPEGLPTFAAHAPRLLIEAFEVAYLLCYPLVPTGFVCLYLAGSPEESGRFWTAVLLASLPCYGLLPWLPTRPPRALEQPVARPRSRVRLLNLKVLGRASIHLNTFPSAHASASLAAALAVGVSVPSAGLVLGLIALAISVGSVVGRYHYAADALSGTVLAVVGFLVSRTVS